jgi:hypothetical protein
VFSTKKRSRTKQRTDNKYIIKPYQPGGEMQDEFMPPTAAQIKCITTKFRRIYSFWQITKQNNQHNSHHLQGFVRYPFGGGR